MIARPLFWGACASALSILIVDLRLDLGAAVAVAYIGVVWMSHFLGYRRGVTIAAGICTVLTIVGWVFSPHTVIAWKVVFNRSISILAIWTVALSCMRVIRINRALRERVGFAEMTSQELADSRAEEHRRSHVISSIVEDLRIEQTKLVESEERFRSAIEHAPTAMIMIDRNGAVQLVNAEAEKLFGYRRSELLGQAVEILVPENIRPSHPELRLGFFAKPEPRRMGEARTLFAQRKDGSLFPVEIALSPVEIDEDVRALGAIIDRTEHENRERILERYTSELERSNRDLDEFANVASHDLRAPLDGIKQLAQWVAEDNSASLQDDSKRHIETMLTRISRLERFLDDLLAYSRAGRHPGEVEDVDLNALVEYTIDVLNLPMGFQVETIGDLPNLRTHRGPIERVFLNLIQNAVKHHDKDYGSIRISGQVLDDWVEFTVADDGPGIPAEFHDRVFKMFETLKPRDTVEGSGMGLSVIKRTVEAFGGKVVIRSGPDRGTAFVFTWPRIIEA